MQEDKEMAKYYTGVVVKQTGEKDNTYYFHDAILVDKKGGAVAFSTTEGDVSDPRATTPRVASIFRSIAEYNGQNGQNTESRKLFQIKEEVEQAKDLIAVHKTGT